VGYEWLSKKVLDMLKVMIFFTWEMSRDPVFCLECLDVAMPVLTHQRMAALDRNSWQTFAM